MRWPILQASYYYFLARLRNALRLFVSALRRPHNFVISLILFIFIVGCLIFFFFVLGPTIQDQVSEFPTMNPLDWVGTFMWGVVALYLVCWPFSVRLGRSLAFQQSEIEFLTAAPLAPQQLISHRILVFQPIILLNAVVTSVFLAALFHSSFLRLSIFLFIWFSLGLMCEFCLGYFVSYFARTRHGYLTWMLSLLLTGGLGCAALLTVFQAQNLFGEIGRFTETPAFQVVIEPMEQLLEPAFSQSWSDFAVAIWFPILVWFTVTLIFFTRPFDLADFVDLDTGAETAPTRSIVVERTAGRNSILKLAATGPNWRAVAWKNLMGISRIWQSSPLRWLLLSYLLILIPLSFVPLSGGFQIFGATVAMTVIMWTLVLGPQTMQAGLKSDMPYFDVLKSMPLHGPELVFGEVIAPFLILCGILLLGFALAMTVGGPLYNPRSTLIIPLLFGVIAIKLTMRNLLLLYLPDFSNLNQKVTKDPILAGLVSSVAFTILLIPAAVVSGLVFGIGYLSGAESLWFSAIYINAGSLVLFLECFLLIHFSEARYQNFDISQENISR